MLTWKGEHRFVVGETAFHLMPPNFFSGEAEVNMHEGDVFVFKPRALIELYAELIAELKPKRVFELGVFQGGSTLFLAELARPQRLVAIDLEPRNEWIDRMDRHAADRGFGDVIRTIDEVDQADRSRLAEIVEDEFDGDALDLVVDDCSHMYEPTRASFSELFPRLRPGGVYVIEDWRWAHTPVGEKPLEGFYPDEVPLTRLLFEIVLATAGIPELISEVTIDVETAVIRRGPASVDPATFDISVTSNPRGRRLLASPDAAKGA